MCANTHRSMTIHSRSTSGSMPPKTTIFRPSRNSQHPNTPWNDNALGSDCLRPLKQETIVVSPSLLAHYQTIWGATIPVASLVQGSPKALLQVEQWGYGETCSWRWLYRYKLQLIGLNRIMFLPWPLLQSSHGDGHLPDCVQQFAHIISELLLILSSS